MKPSKVYIRFICLLLAMCICFPRLTYAKDSPITIAEMDKTVYYNYSSDQVYAEYKKNAFRAKELYKDFFLGLIGKAESISANGKQIVISSSSTDMKFICECSDKKIKEQVKAVSSGDSIIVCGKVKKPDEKEFILKANTIIPIKNDIKKYENGITSSDGTVFLPTEIASYTLGNYQCYIQSKWEKQKNDEYWNNKIEKEFANKEGMVVQLSDDKNAETVGIFKLSWNEIKNKANKRKFYEFEDNHVEEFLVPKLINKRLNYTFGVTNTKKTEYAKFDYLHGTREDNVNSELFFLKDGDDLIVLTYIYTDEPKNASQVQVLVGSLRKFEK